MRILYLIILGVGLYLPLSVCAGDLLLGKTKAKATCAVCHGIDGQATVPLAAHLSGQQKDYLIIQMRAYRSGKRHHDQMSIIAKPLTNEEIDNLAEWYSNIKVKIEVPEKFEVEEIPSASMSEEVKIGGADEFVFDPELIKLIQKSMQAFVK